MALFFIRTFTYAMLSTMQGVLHLLYQTVFPPANVNRGENRSILIIQEGQIGDFIITLPLIGLLKRKYGAGTQIDMLVHRGNEPLGVLVQDEARKVIYYSSKKYSTAAGRSESYTGLGSGHQARFPASELDDIYDEAIWIRGDFSTFLWLATRKMPLRSVMARPNPLRWAWIPLLTGRPVSVRKEHMWDSIRVAVGDATEEGKVMASPYQMRAENRQRQARKVYVHCAAGGELRRWPEERFALLIAKLLEGHSPMEVYLIGAWVDAAIAERIAKHEKLATFVQDIHNICGKTPINELPSLLSEGDLYIGFDSGPLHIAALSGIPAVALMGPQSPTLFAPRSKGEVRVVYKAFPCSPCWQFSCPYSASTVGACVLAISVDDVYQAASSLLGDDRCRI